MIFQVFVLERSGGCGLHGALGDELLHALLGPVLLLQRLLRQLLRALLVLLCQRLGEPLLCEGDAKALVLALTLEGGVAARGAGAGLVAGAVLVMMVVHWGGRSVERGAVRERVRKSCVLLVCCVNWF